MKLHLNVFTKVISRSNSGFTIVELLMYMGLVTMLIAIMTSIFLSALEAQLSAQASSSSLTAGRYILSRLEYDLRRADSVEQPVSMGQSGSEMTIVVNGNDLTYSQNSGRLTLTTDANTSELNEVGTIISDLSFTKIGNPGGKPTVIVSFTVTGTDSQPSEVRTFESAIGLR